MLIIPPPKYRKREQVKVAASPLPALELTLLAAGYDPVALVVLLTFDRAVDVDGFDGSQVTVFDAQTNHTKYTGGAASLTGGMGVAVSLVALGPVHGTGAEIDATAQTGIVAVDDGGTWPGVGFTGLPYTA